jgi:hypothetical protein
MVLLLLPAYSSCKNVFTKLLHSIGYLLMPCCSNCHAACCDMCTWEDGLLRPKRVKVLIAWGMNPIHVCRIWGSHGVGYEEFFFFSGILKCHIICWKSADISEKIYHPNLQYWRISQAKNHCEVTVNKQSSQLADIFSFVGNMTEIQDGESDSIGSWIGHAEPAGAKEQLVSFRWPCHTSEQTKLASCSDSSVLVSPLDIVL